jgi:hypothetical protein
MHSAQAAGAPRAAPTPSHNDPAQCRTQALVRLPCMRCARQASAHCKRGRRWARRSASPAPPAAPDLCSTPCPWPRSASRPRRPCVADGKQRTSKEGHADARADERHAADGDAERCTRNGLPRVAHRSARACVHAGDRRHRRLDRRVGRHARAAQCHLRAACVCTSAAADPSEVAPHIAASRAVPATLRAPPHSLPHHLLPTSRARPPSRSRRWPARYLAPLCIVTHARVSIAAFASRERARPGHRLEWRFRSPLSASQAQFLFRPQGL